MVFNLTMYGISVETAPISARLNCESLWNGNESPKEYPTNYKSKD